MDRYVLRMRWGNRADDAESCALAILKSCRALGELDQVLSSWRLKASTRKRALESAYLDKAALIRALDREKIKQERASGGRHRLGSTVGMWNGLDDDRAASITVTCGLSTATEGSGLANGIDVHLPKSITMGLTADKLVPVVAEFAKVWRPDYGGVYSEELLVNARSSGKRSGLGWISYVPARMEVAPKKAAQTVDLGDLGSIVVATADPIRANSATDLELLTQLRAELEYLGITPIQTVDAKFSLPQ